MKRLYQGSFVMKKDMMRIFMTVTAVSLYLMLGGGCAFVNQKIDLAYHTTSPAHGGRGELYVARPIEKLTLPKDNKGYSIIGTVKNTIGMKTADVVTSDDIGDWVANALGRELQNAGYQVTFIEKMTEGVGKGVEIVILEFFIDQDPGMMTVGAITRLSMNLNIWKEGRLIQTLNIVGKGDSRSAVGSAETKGLSAQKALQACMSDAVPKIVNTLQ
jgi:hypothetical protein